MFKKGNVANPKGRPRGSTPISLRASLNRLLTRKEADEIVKSFITKCKNGEYNSIKLLAEILGEVGKAVPSVAVQINNGLSEADLIARAKKYAGISDVTDKSIVSSKPPLSIIDTSVVVDPPLSGSLDVLTEIV